MCILNWVVGTRAGTQRCTASEASTYKCHPPCSCDGWRHAQTIAACSTQQRQRAAPNGPTGTRDPSRQLSGGSMRYFERHMMCLEHRGRANRRTAAKNIIATRSEAMPKIARSPIDGPPPRMKCCRPEAMPKADRSPACSLVLPSLPYIQ